MNADEQIKLLQLADDWRNSAAAVEIRNKERFPLQTAAVTATFERCAEELETFARAAATAPPNPS